MRWVLPPRLRSARAGRKLCGRPNEAGDLFDHEYTVERGGREVAQVSKRLLTVRDTYAVDIAPGEDDLLILAAVVVVDLAESRAERTRAGG